MKKACYTFFCMIVSMCLASIATFEITSASYKREIEYYIGFLTSEQNNKDADTDKKIESSKKYGQIHTAVVIPDNLVDNNDDKSKDQAKKFLSRENEWLYITKRNISEHTIFIFRATEPPSKRKGD